MRVFIFRETSHMRSFVKIKSLRNGKITVITDVGQSCPSRANFNIPNMCLKAIRNNKILAKISEFTVLH